jgi:hypothetical protein
MNIAILLQCEDWEGLYINDRLVKEGHTLNEGTNRLKFFAQLSRDCDFDLNYLKVLYLCEDDEKLVMDIGNMPNHIAEFNNDYKNMKDDE